MKLAAHALPKALAAGLKPVYLILGEEPLAALEAADAVRAAARSAGFGERVPLFAEPGFSWASLATEGASRSLFADKRLLDLKIPGGKPGNEGSRALVEYAGSPPADTVLLVTAMNTDWKTAKTAWVKALAGAGALVECKPVPAAKMPQWVEARMKARRLKAPAGAAALIGEYAQGNLLAAAQVVERLALVAEDGTVDMEAVQATLVDETRFGLFELVDTALAGQRGAMLHILARLRETGMAEPLLLWALARELRTLEAVAWAAERGGAGPRIFPPTRRALVTRAATRRNARGWQALIADAAILDRAMKGRASENATVLIERLLIRISTPPRARPA
ncbi:MAG: DNA polymerase III subunit delta [Gammaproteobacteria bacterium]|nr:DNA polymerase III subunit delta [Gammaproteobacteria bacterium]